MKAFGELKEKLVSATTIISLDWSKPFDVMYAASGVALGVALGKISDKIIHLICYASKTLNETQKKYTVTEQELLAVVLLSKNFAPIWHEIHSAYIPLCFEIFDSK